MQKPIPSPSPEVVLPPNYEHEYFRECAAHPFRHTTSEFELVNAWWMAESALLAYAHYEFVASCFEEAGLQVEGLQPFSGTSTQCYIAHNDEYVIVTFRGTQVPKLRDDQDSLAGLRDSISDIYTDIKFALVDSGNEIFVHRGFKEALEEVWVDVEQHVDTLKTEKPNRTIWFTGHSLGAALATLAAHRYTAVNGLYTFGSPRVGGRKFFKNFHLDTFRFVNNNDVVTKVPTFGPYYPPRLLPGLYKHVGQLKYIDSKHKVTNRPRTWSRLVNGVETVFSRPKSSIMKSDLNSLGQISGDHFTDHAPLYYSLHTWNNYMASRKS